LSWEHPHNLAWKHKGESSIAGKRLKTSRTALMHRKLRDLWLKLTCFNPVPTWSIRGPPGKRLITGIALYVLIMPVTRTSWRERAAMRSLKGQTGSLRVARTYPPDRLWDHLRGASLRVTERPYYSAVGKAGYTGKGRRQSD
jgi:hypothetical protein